MKTTLLKISLFFIILFGTCYADKNKEKSNKPNIIIILADDLGWSDVGFNGSDIETPNIDRIAFEGAKLSRYYVSPVCSPTRATLMTGRHPLRYGLQYGVCAPTSNHGLPPEEFNLPEMLAEAGYKHRGCFGKWHLGLSSKKFNPMNQGFTHFYGHLNGEIDYFDHKRAGEMDWHYDDKPCYDKGYATDLIGQNAVRFLNESAGEDPFFMYVAFNAPHSPMQATRKKLDSLGFKPNDELMPNGSIGRAKSEGQPTYGFEGRGNTLRQTYAAMIMSMDDQIGNILDALEKKNIAENTIVLFHSDNGGTSRYGGTNLPFRAGKFEFYEGGVRAAAAIRWPKKIEANSKVDTVIGCVDIWPTFAHLVGVKKPESLELDGYNMGPSMFANAKADLSRKLFLGRNSAVSDKWKFVKGKELYNIQSDPYERNNVISQYPEVASEFKTFTDSIEAKKGKQFTLGSKMKKGARPPKNWQLVE